MSVSDDSAGGKNGKAPRRKWSRLSDDVWSRIRLHYETKPADYGYRDAAFEFGIPESTLTKRACREKWRKHPKIADSIAEEMQRSAIAEVRSVIQQETRKLGEQVRNDLAPWLERQRTRHVKRAVGRSTRAQKRLDKVAKGYQIYDAKAETVVDLDPTPKDEALIATAEEKYDAIIRRNLGMNDGTPIAGGLNLSILCNQAAVQVTT